MESSYQKLIRDSIRENVRLHRGWKTLSNQVYSIDLIDPSVLAVESSYRKSTRERLGENTALWQHGGWKVLTNRLDLINSIDLSVLVVESSHRKSIHTSLGTKCCFKATGRVENVVKSSRFDRPFYVTQSNCLTGSRLGKDVENKPPCGNMEGGKRWRMDSTRLICVSSRIVSLEVSFHCENSALIFICDTYPWSRAHALRTRKVHVVFSQVYF